MIQYLFFPLQWFTRGNMLPHDVEPGALKIPTELVADELTSVSHVLQEGESFSLVPQGLLAHECSLLVITTEMGVIPPPFHRPGSGVASRSE